MKTQFKNDTSNQSAIKSPARLLLTAVPAALCGLAGGVQAAPAPGALRAANVPAPSSSRATGRNSAAKKQTVPVQESRSTVATLRQVKIAAPAPDGKGWTARATLPFVPPRLAPAPRHAVSSASAPHLASSAAAKTTVFPVSTGVATAQNLSQAAKVSAPSAQAQTTAPTQSQPAQPQPAQPQPAQPQPLPSGAPRVAQTYSTPRATVPTPLASRHAERDRLVLAQLEADLKRTRSDLNSAGADLSGVERQLAGFTNTLRQAMFEAGPDASGLHPFVRVAQRYAGTPYVWGGESGRGFDCSGFIIRVMRDLGYRALPHSAATQFNYGKPIAQALLKPGDLVFFANTYKPGISHVGIYLGRRRFIHAAGTGMGTIVSSLDSAKYQAKYAGARRLIAARR